MKCSFQPSITGPKKYESHSLALLLLSNTIVEPHKNDTKKVEKLLLSDLNYLNLQIEYFPIKE